MSRARRRAEAPRTPLTPAGWSLLGGGVAVYAGGVALGYPELITLAAGGLTLLAVAAGGVLLRPRLALERQFHPRRVSVGEPVLGQLQVRNLSRWPSLPFIALDRLGSQALELRIGSLAPRGVHVARYTVPNTRRGRYRLGPLSVERRDPLGLLRRGQPHGSTGTLWVHPRVHPLVPLPAGVLLDYEGALTVTAAKGAVTFSSLREYVPGDDPRHLHWKSTARTGTLMVKEHVDTSLPRTAVLLDTRASVWPGDSFEQGVEVAASVVVTTRRSGRPVALHLAGGLPADLEAGSGPLDQLAAVEPLEDRDPLRLLLRAEQIEPGGAFVVVTGRAEQATLARLTSLRRRFAPLVLVQLDQTGPLATSRWAGIAIVRAASSADAAGAWNRFVLGRSA
jgi:uncharacterized protein (DUF58 family)